MEDGTSRPTNRNECSIRNPKWYSPTSPERFKNSADTHASSMIQFNSSLNEGIDQQTSHHSFPVILPCAVWNFLEMFL
jgi:hypothetical protein